MRTHRDLRRAAFALSLIFWTLGAGCPARAAEVAPWLLSTFDAGAGFSTGALAGQGGWTTSAKSAVVVACGVNAGGACNETGAATPGRGQILALNPDPGSGATVDIGKVVTSQGSGFQVIEFDAMVTGAVDPSVGKIEFQTPLNNGWDKKFQLFFGTSIRVNYSPAGASQTLVAATQARHWYHLRCNLDVNAGQMSIWVDDALATPTALPLHPGAIIGIALTGWEFRAGKVYVDNLVGASNLARLEQPGRGTTLAGLTEVTVAALSGVSTVEFYVDGALASTSSAPPFHFSWNSADNPYPPPNHAGFPGRPFALGYWRNQWMNDQTTINGCCFAETAPYTNLYLADTRSDYQVSSGEPTATWLPRMREAVDQAFQAGKQILLNLEIPFTCTGNFGSNVTWCADLDQVLDMVRPYWAQIVAVDLADEPSWSQNATKIQAAIASFQSSRQARGLAPVPIGLVYAHRSSLDAAVLAATSLNFVSLEAYLNPPGQSNPYEFSPLSQANRSLLRSQLLAQRNIAVQANKMVVYIAQAYSRNFGWASIDLVRDLQAVPYLLAANDPWVLGVTLFSYLRASGAREYPDLRVPHRMIGEVVTGIVQVPPAANGPRTLSIRALDAAGNSTWDSLKVLVQN